MTKESFFTEVYRATQWDAQGDADHASEHYLPSDVINYLKENGDNELADKIISEEGEPEF